MTATTQRDPKWDERMEVQKQHIRWREQFYGVKFNILQKAYAHFRMAFVKKDTIIGANCTLAQHVQDHGTARKFAEAIGDTAFNAHKGIGFVATVKRILAWTIRAPFVVVGITALLTVELCQAIIRRLPGSVE